MAPQSFLLFRGDDRETRSLRPANEGRGPVQVASRAARSEDREKKLGARSPGKAHSSGVFLASAEPRGKVAFLFPGQGSQRVGMLRDLFDAYPELDPGARARSRAGRDSCIRRGRDGPKTRPRKRRRSPTRASRSPRWAWRAGDGQALASARGRRRTCSPDTATASSSRCALPARCRGVAPRLSELAAGASSNPPRMRRIPGHGGRRAAIRRPSGVASRPDSQAW
jgi:hypothetical protein